MEKKLVTVAEIVLTLNKVGTEDCLNLDHIQKCVLSI
jgi:hypothetical protein